MSGMFRNMSLLKTRLPGLLSKVVWMPVCMACVAIDSVSSMKSFALERLVEVPRVGEFVERFLLFDASVHRLHWLVDFYSMMEHL
jgi:hypothetical protein